MTICRQTLIVACLIVPILFFFQSLIASSSEGLWRATGTSATKNATTISKYSISPAWNTTNTTQIDASAAGDSDSSRTFGKALDHQTTTITQVAAPATKASIIKQPQQPLILPLAPWEVNSVETRTCTPDPAPQHDGAVIPQYCCLGSTSTGGIVQWFEGKQCEQNSTAYQQIEKHTIQYLQKHYGAHDDDNNQQQDTPCDTCRILDLLIQHNLSLSFVGDSMTRQVAAGLECELLRRGYRVNKTGSKGWWVKNDTHCPSWRYCISRKDEYAVSRVATTSSDAASFDQPDTTATAYIRYYEVYRPSETDDNDQVKKFIIQTSDIVVFDHGLHWQMPDELVAYRVAMTKYLRGFVEDAKNLTLLAWRETSAQHFDAQGGHFQKKTKCFPMRNVSDHGDGGFRLPLMRQAAHDAGLSWKSTLDANFSSSPEAENQSELVLLPFRGYTVPLHYFHPGECTHYCHTPYLWLPIWRALRIALDRAVRLKQQQ